MFHDFHCFVCCFFNIFHDCSSYFMIFYGPRGGQWASGAHGPRGRLAPWARVPLGPIAVPRGPSGGLLGPLVGGHGVSILRSGVKFENIDFLNVHKTGKTNM